MAIFLKTLIHVTPTIFLYFANNKFYTGCFRKTRQICYNFLNVFQYVFITRMFQKHNWTLNFLPIFASDIIRVIVGWGIKPSYSSKDR